MLELASQLLSLVVIDLVLSGDNAIVIGMAAAPLPPRHRRVAILAGGGLAIALRIALTWVAVELLRIPFVGAIGGVLLLWIGFNLLKQEQESAQGIKEAASLPGAILTITLADLIMSLDNVLGVAAAARGSVWLLIFGLLLSMTIVIGGGGLLAGIIGRFTWLAYLGSAVIAWTGAQMVLGDDWAAQFVSDQPPSQALISALVTVGVVLLAHMLYRHKPTGAQLGRRADS